MARLIQYVLTVVLLMTALNVNAEFYMDCNKAATQIEKHICDNKLLWKLDGELNRHYDSALSRSSDPGKIRLEQRRWIKEVRDRCKDNGCLNGVYNDQIKYLSQLNFTDPYCGDNRYSPYPDVWGYDLGQNGATAASIYSLPGGEVWVRYAKRNDAEYIQCFFSGNLSRIKQPERAGYSAYENILTFDFGGLRLPDGSILTKRHAYSGSRCDSGFGSYIEKRSPDGNIGKRIAFLIPLETPIERPVACEGDLQTVKTYVINATPSEIISLADDSALVLVGQFEQPFAIRFDYNLNTKFNSDKLLVVDWNDIDRLYSQSKDFQDLANRVRQYVIQKLKERPSH